MDIRAPGPECKHAGRPPRCPVCGGPSWWNGLRTVAQMVQVETTGVRRVVDLIRLRARCADPACKGGSWTLYEAQGYPHRTFTLAVAAAAVVELAVAPNATLASVARRCQCDPRTVGRWKCWASGLCDPVALSRLCSRLEPDGFPPPRQGGMLLAGFMVLLLEHLARLLRDQGVPLAPGPGLAAILHQQFDRFRAVSWLTRASPPLQLEGAMAGV